MAGGISLELAEHLYPHYMGNNPQARQLDEARAIADYQAEQEHLARARDEFAAKANR